MSKYDQVQKHLNRKIVQEAPGRSALDMAYCDHCNENMIFRCYSEQHSDSRGLYDLQMWLCGVCENEHPTKKRKEIWPKSRKRR